MCGIVGYVGKRDAVPILLNCLQRLEYRGYDSAGIGVIEDGQLVVRKRMGRSTALETLMKQAPSQGKLGIAHTRWATHGQPADENAHPHTDCSRSLAIVHNGIIENHRELRKSLEQDGHHFESETDTEVIAHLLENGQDTDMQTATREAVHALRGGYALGIISRREPGILLAVRNGGPPLVIGQGDDGVFLSSDVAAILPYTRDVRVLEDGEIATLSANEVRIETFSGRPVNRKSVRVPWDAAAAEKGGYPHFMLKEIHEQPRSIQDTIHGQSVLKSGVAAFPECALTAADLAAISRISIVACGTSWHAALVGKYVIEGLARIPVDVDIASEFRYRAPILDHRALVMGISQSGETADTLGALKEAKCRAARVLAICNVVGSSMSREADAVIYTHAGPEIGVASTKSFTCQLTTLILFAISAGVARGTLTRQDARAHLQQLMELPRILKQVLAGSSACEEVARVFHRSRNFLYLGRGNCYPMALEGALKLKEISYIHAEGYPAGEMKHGPIALIDRDMPVLVIAPQGPVYQKVLGSIEEVKARNGRVIAIASEGDEDIAARADYVIHIPRAAELFAPILAAIPLQLIAYHIAVLRGCNVDQPRNLAKSVTVE